MPSRYFNLGLRRYRSRPGYTKKQKPKAEFIPQIITGIITLLMAIATIYCVLAQHYLEGSIILSALTIVFADFRGKSWIVKRIIVGYLSNSCTKVLLNEKNLVIQEKKLTSENLHVFSRVVLSLNLPDLRPVLYLRVRKKPVYLKIGPFNTSTFKFERNIRRRRTAFFDWLERAQPEIGPDLMSSIMNRYLNDDVTGSRRKPCESPDII